MRGMAARAITRRGRGFSGVGALPPTLEFDSLWDFATGPSDPAIEDNGVWDPLLTSNNVGTSEGLLVAAASGASPFVTNALEVRYRSASTGYAFLRRAGLVVPAVGASKWYRWGFRQRFTQDQVLNSPHPIQDGSAAGQTNWMFMQPPSYVTATTYRPRYQVSALINTGRYSWLGPVLTIGDWYRFEHQVHRIDTTLFDLHVRTYNAAGTLIATDVDYVNEFNGAQNLSANGGAFTFFNVNNLDGINAGANGITPGTTPIADNGALFDQACLAISNVGWIGPPA